MCSVTQKFAPELRPASRMASALSWEIQTISYRLTGLDIILGRDLAILIQHHGGVCQAIQAFCIGGFVTEYQDLAQVEVDIFRLVVAGDPRVLRQIKLIHLAEVGTQTGPRPPGCRPWPAAP